MKRVYIAGAFSSDNILQVFENMRLGMRASVKVLLSGYAPFCPWLDYHFSLMIRDTEKLEVENYYNYSLAWLEVSDALIVLPNWESSVGTKREIEVARKLGMPIFYNIDDFLSGGMLK